MATRFIPGLVLAAVVAVAALTLILVVYLFRKKWFGPRFFPHTLAFIMRASGAVLALAWRFKLTGNVHEKTSMELADCLRGTRAKHLTPLRDACLALDRQPTIQTGNRALGIQSVFETFVEPVRLRTSPYTHPLQKPNFYIPGVPAKPFYDSGDFPITPQLENAYPEIRAELEGLLSARQSQFIAYTGGNGIVQPGWNNCYFYLFDQRNEENCKACPRTAAILDSIPRLDKTMAMFAALNPKSSLPPHTGPANGILRVHLPLIVPEGCAIRVAGEAREWEEGKVLIFDDSFVHEVENTSDFVRVVLFFSIYHPCFQDEEISALKDFSDAWKALPVTQLYEKFQHRPRSGGLVMQRPATMHANAPSQV